MKRDKIKKNKKKLFLCGLLLFFVMLTTETFILGALLEIIPKDFTLFGQPFPLSYFIWGIMSLLIFLILITVGLKKYMIT